MTDRRGRRHVIRPRWTWGGLLLLLVGGVLLGLGIALLSWPWALVGVVALGAGLFAATRGGMYYDTHQDMGIGETVEAVKTGETHDAPGPDTLLGDERLRTEVALATRQEVDLIRRESVPLGWGDVHDFGVMLVIVIGFWLGLGSMWIYPTTVDGQLGSVRDAIAAAVIASCGLQLKLANKPSPIAGGLALLSGLALIAFGLFLGQASTGSQVQEIACGVLVAVGALLAARLP